MVIVTKLKDMTFMEVRIRNGHIYEIFYRGTVEEKTFLRMESDDIKACLKDILKADVGRFKDILSNIQEDEEFFDYAKELLTVEKQKKIQNLMDYKKECDHRLKQLEDVVNKYNWP